MALWGPYGGPGARQISQMVSAVWGVRDGGVDGAALAGGFGGGGGGGAGGGGVVVDVAGAAAGGGAGGAVVFGFGLAAGGGGDAGGDGDGRGGDGDGGYGPAGARAGVRGARGLYGRDHDNDGYHADAGEPEFDDFGADGCDHGWLVLSDGAGTRWDGERADVV